jgi:cell division transport system permease protein
MNEWLSKVGIRIRPNYLYASVSMSLVLFLAGLFGSMILQSRQLARLFKEQVMVVAELEHDVDSLDVDTLMRDWGARSDIKPGSLEYTSKEVAADIIRDDFGEDVDLSQYNLGNPLYDIITFNLRAEFMTPKGLSRIGDELQEDERVAAVLYEEGLTDGISGYWGKLGLMGFVVSVILGVVAAFLIMYAVRQALYADRFLIKNMHLVGATPLFIGRPYLRDAVLGGVLSALLAGVGLLMLRIWLIGQLPGIEQLFTMSVWLKVLGMMLVFGMAITAGSAWLTIRQYLSGGINDLYR